MLGILQGHELEMTKTYLLLAPYDHAQTRASSDRHFQCTARGPDMDEAHWTHLVLLSHLWLRELENAENVKVNVCGVWLGLKIKPGHFNSRTLTYDILKLCDEVRVRQAALNT